MTTQTTNQKLSSTEGSIPKSSGKSLIDTYKGDITAAASGSFLGFILGNIAVPGGGMVGGVIGSMVMIWLARRFESSSHSDLYK